MIKPITIALLAASLVAACGGSSSNQPQTPAQKIAALEASGAIPVLERSDTLEGIDSNNSGVRDDVEAYIYNNYPSENQRNAAMQLARGLQESLLVNLEDNSALRLVDRNVNGAVSCIYKSFGEAKGAVKPGKVVYDLEAIITNTKQRLEAYLAYNRSLDGTTSARPKGGSCE